MARRPTGKGYDMPYIGVELRCLNDGSLITTSREWADKCTDFIG